MSKLVAPQMPRKVREVVTQTWQTEANLSVFLLLLVLVIFVIPSLGLERDNERLYGNLMTSVLLLAGPQSPGEDAQCSSSHRPSL